MKGRFLFWLRTLILRIAFRHVSIIKGCTIRTAEHETAMGTEGADALITLDNTPAWVMDNMVFLGDGFPRDKLILSD